MPIFLFLNMNYVVPMVLVVPCPSFPKFTNNMTLTLQLQRLVCESVLQVAHEIKVTSPAVVAAKPSVAD